MKKIMTQVILYTVLLVCLQLSGCATRLTGLEFYDGQIETDQTSSQTVNLQYLGVAGYLIEWRGERMMIAPSFTNPSLLELAPFHKIKADEALIDKMLPDVSDVETVLVGHAHYDHLMDLPYIMQKHAPKSVVCGSDTVGHIMAAVLEPSRIVKLNAHMAVGEHPGKWIYTPSRKMRFMAIKSEHAPHLWGVKVYKGTYKQDLTELPRTADNWLEGQTFAYLIDFLDKRERVKFRIHFQDAASTPPLGFVPTLTAADQHPVNLAILCVGGFKEVRGYPTGVVKHLNADYYLMGHWEDFFGNNDIDHQKIKVLRMNNIRDFIRRLDQAKPEDAKNILPKPMDKIIFPVDN